MPGLFLIGLGLGGMLTPSVNVVQSSFPEELQGEISGLSRSISNLGSSFGTAIAGTILVSVVALGTRSYAVALIVLVGIGLLGLVAAQAARGHRPSGGDGGFKTGRPDRLTTCRDRLGMRALHHGSSCACNLPIWRAGVL